MLDSFGIFEGGGAKGLAHIGALKAAEVRRLNFLGVAGTSAGSIVAALIAAGWHSDELYDPLKPVGKKGRFELDFLDFFDRRVWTRLIELKADAAKTFSGGSPTRVWCRAPQFYFRNRDLLDSLSRDRGFFRTDRFSAWLESILGEKVTGTGPGSTVHFKDLNVPLKIIVTDLTNQSIRLFGSGQDETPNERVTEAVAASITIPFFFIPHTFQFARKTIKLVDGGLLSNFPAWVFDEERMKAGALTPTFGFTLVEKNPVQTADMDTLLGFTAQLFTTALAGDALLETRQVANLQIIPLPVSVSTFDFDISPNVKDALYNEGLTGATRYFEKYIGPRDRNEMSAQLKILHAYMQRKIARGDIHLRLNVVMPTHKDRLRILYTFNMDVDADDRLEFSMDAGSSGLCWQTHDFVVCDLVDAKATFQSKYKMTKYQQALVRRELRSLLSVPIFDQDQFSERKAKTEIPLIGVLNFDSDENLLEDFTKVPIQQTAAECAKHMWRALSGKG